MLEPQRLPPLLSSDATDFLELQEKSGHTADPLHPSRRHEFTFRQQQITGKFNMPGGDSLPNNNFHCGTDGGAGRHQILQQQSRPGWQQRPQGKLADRLAGIGDRMLEASRF